jgi:hypothetical protein
MFFENEQHRRDGSTNYHHGDDYWSGNGSGVPQTFYDILVRVPEP